MKSRPQLCLVTPALAAANNGNWQTAARWAQMLAADYRVRLISAWDGGASEDAHDVAMIALHARRSAASIAAWRAQPPRRPLVLALTGTDLYRDIQTDAAAQRSLALADRLIVPQPAHAAEVTAPAACLDGRPPARRKVARDLL